jgi:aryl carrier-like protein
MSEQAETKRVVIMRDGSTITLDRRWLDVRSDLRKDASKNPRHMADCSAVIADSLQQLLDYEAQYRQWKAKVKLEELAKDAKIAEWKAEAAYQATPEYLEYSEVISLKRADMSFAENIFAALQAKSPVVRDFRREDTAVDRDLNGAGDEVSGEPLGKIPRALREKTKRNLQSSDED